MTTPREPDSIVIAWLEEGPTELPESTRRAIAVATRTTTQHRRPMWASWRNQSMNPFSKVALVALALVAIVGGGVYLLAPGGQVGGPSATQPAAAPSAVPPSPAPGEAVPADWTTYVSSRFGYSIDVPTDWVTTPATEDWPVVGWPHQDEHAGDRFGPPPFASTKWVFVSSEMLDPGETAEERIADLDVENSSYCTVSNQRTIVVDGANGRREDQFCFSEKDILESVVIHDDRVFLINFWSSGVATATDRATYDRFLDSFRFGTTTAFTSTRYGFTVQYPNDLVANPSQGDWTYPNLFEPHDRNFDGFTGSSTNPTGQAWVGIASMPLPDGMTGDDWMTWYEERNEALYGAFCPQVPGGAWKPADIAGVAGRISEADCGYDVTVTEIVFTDAGRGWIISGDTPLVEAMSPTLQLPG